MSYVLILLVAIDVVVEVSSWVPLSLLLYPGAMLQGS
jgi:hypothetical protein